MQSESQAGRAWPDCPDCFKSIIPHGLGTALKPANEPICVARKPLEKGLTVAQNVLKWGCGALNIDASRIKSQVWEPGDGHSNSNVEDAEKTPRLGALAIKEYSATKHAAQTMSEKESAELRDTNKTDIGCSAGPSQAVKSTSQSELGNLNTGQYGKNSTAQFQTVIASTTLMKTDPTTDSKTSNSCSSQSTPKCTPPNGLREKNNSQSTLAAPASSGPQGRWPSNVILDEAAAEMLDEQSGILNSGKPGIKRNGNNGAVYGAESRAPGTQMSGFGDSGGASRFFYVAKASKRERNAGLEGEMKQKQGARPKSADASGKFPDHDHRETGGNNHPTVKPIKLMEYLIKLVTPPNGIVMDPFMGSGSTGVAAKNLGFQFIGIEMNEDYFAIAEKRMSC